MPKSRKIWSYIVSGLGLLWTLGGLAGLLQGNWRMWIMVLLGLGLLRLGYNMRTVRPGEQP